MKIGDKVKWTMLDGNTMAGTIQDFGYEFLSVKRVDGTPCYVRASAMRPATPNDILKACQFFERNK